MKQLLFYLFLFLGGGHFPLLMQTILLMYPCLLLGQVMLVMEISSQNRFRCLLHWKTTRLPSLPQMWIIRLSCVTRMAHLFTLPSFRRVQRR